VNSDESFLRSVFQTGNNLEICNKFFEERVAFEAVARTHRTGTNREKIA